MNEYTTEEEELERLKNWWHDNKWFVIVGVVVGVGSLFSWNWYKDMERTRTESASVLYDSLIKSVTAGNREDAIKHAATLTSDYEATPYDAQAQLALAKLHMDENDTDAAMAALKEAIKRGNHELAHIARLRLARVQISVGQATEAQKTLQVSDEGEFEPLYQETRGDALVALGDTEGAIKEYKLALGHEIPIGDTRFLEIKLQNLGATVD